MSTENSAHALAEQLTAVALVWIGHAECTQVIDSFEPIIAEALSAAEARGRQQAEQERPDWQTQRRTLQETILAQDKTIEELESRVQQAEQERDEAETQCAEHQRGENEALNRLQQAEQARDSADKRFCDEHRGVYDTSGCVICGLMKQGEELERARNEAYSEGMKKGRMSEDILATEFGYRADKAERQVSALTQALKDVKAERDRLRDELNWCWICGGPHDDNMPHMREVSEDGE